jgi:hypothetical protein
VPCDGEDYLIKDNVSLFHTFRCIHVLTLRQELRQRLVDPLPLGCSLIVSLVFYSFPAVAHTHPGSV